MRKLAVIYPWSSPFIWTACTDSMLNLRRPDDTEVRFFRGQGWCPARRHIHGCEQAMGWGADYLLILGSDQVYDEDLLERLMGRMDEDYDCVAAFVPARVHIGWMGMRPYQPMAWRFKSMDETGQGNRCVPYLGLEKSRDLIAVVDPQPGDPEMMRINFIGSGVLMFRREQLEALRKPWFFETYDPRTYERHASMDTKFVWRLQWEAMSDLWLDTTINVKHIHPSEIDRDWQRHFSGGGDWSLPAP